MASDAVRGVQSGQDEVPRLTRLMAVVAVSASRISPTRSHQDFDAGNGASSASSGVDADLALGKRDIRLEKRYSIGSSIVITWRDEFSFNHSRAAARVVLFPEPVGPQTKTIPARLLIQSQRSPAGTPRVSISGISLRMRRRTAARCPS